MSETVAIILRFRDEDAEQFESAFKAEVYPLWEEFKAQGKFISASLTPALVRWKRKEGWISRLHSPRRGPVQGGAFGIRLRAALPAVSGEVQSPAAGGTESLAREYFISDLAGLYD